MVFFRKAIFLHFAYSGRSLAEDCGAVSEDLAVKENIYITQKEKVLKQQNPPPLEITQFIIAHTLAGLHDL